MTRRFWITAIAAAVFAFGAAEAKAAPITLDFASSLYNGADGSSLFFAVDQGVLVGVASGPGSTISHTAQGFGVNSGVPFEDPNEVGAAELLLTGFVPSQFVYSVQIERFFSNEFPAPETGYYSINGGAWTPFVATNTSGLFTLNLGLSGVDSIAFSGAGNLLFNDDYAVRSITVEGPRVNQNPVPEPASMILLGSGLVGAFAHRRRKKA